MSPKEKPEKHVRDDERNSAQAGLRPEDVRPTKQIGDPGQYPYTRGVHETMYRGKLWTMRMFAGFGTPEDTNQRFHFLLEQGQTGLSTAFDMPTLMGYDPDHRALARRGRPRGRVGRLPRRHGAAVRRHPARRRDHVDDHQRAGGLSAGRLRRRRRAARACRRRKLRGTMQNDMLKEFIAQKEWISPVRPSMRIIRDMLVYCTREMPLWNTISISGYHIREAGRDRGAGAGLHARRRHRLRAARRRRRASTSTSSRRGCRSSSTCTTTSSRRSPSSAPRGACGRASCASASAPRTRARGCCARTRRPPACR